MNLYLLKGGSLSVSLHDDQLWEYGSQRWTRFVGLRTMYISLMSSVQTLSRDFYQRLLQDIKALPKVTLYIQDIIITTSVLSCPHILLVTIITQEHDVLYQMINITIMFTYKIKIN